MFNRVAVGGTFDHLHTGHKTLIEKAFEVGKQVVIGITLDEMLKEKNAEDFQKRKKVLEEFLSSFSGYEVVAIGDVYGPAVSDPKMDAIVVSQKTEFRARELNKIRQTKGLTTLSIIVVPIVLAEDGGLISSTRIRMGEIDDAGNLLTKG
ncbi:MAG: pantetheine-phosphate adenylyltransferase [Candidatus Hydrothermarchaeales archaeon]